MYRARWGLQPPGDSSPWGACGLCCWLVHNLEHLSYQINTPRYCLIEAQLLHIQTVHIKTHKFARYSILAEVAVVGTSGPSS